MGGGDTVIAGFGATESSEVGAGAEFMADIFGKSADVGAGGDVGTDFEFGVIVAEDFDTIDFYLAGGECEILAFAGEFVGALAVNLDGTESGWGLGDFADEAG